MKKVLLIIVGAIAGVVLLAYVAGSLLPRDHLAATTISLNAPPERVWELVSDFQGTARWRREITAVEMQPVGGGPVRFKETSSFGTVEYEVVSQRPPSEQILRVVDEGQPFGGTWTWRIDAVGSGSRLTITEDGFVKSPMFRVMGKLFFSPTRTMEQYLRSLAAELGESAVPAVVRLTADRSD